MTILDPEQLRGGVELLVKHLEELQSETPELGDFHAAFEHYCMLKYALGSAATTYRTAGQHDLGIDFYSTKERKYHVAQCKIPEKEWLESHPTKVRQFGPAALADPRTALGYLFGEPKLRANESVKRLYALIESDRSHEDFQLVFFLIVFGRLNERAEAGFQELKTEYEACSARLVLLQVDDLVDEFIVGAARAHAAEIQLDLRISANSILRQPDYCYLLANAADLFEAFKTYGWRLFDLNLRYEVRNSAVNGDIVESLRYRKTRKRFHHYNNGLIVTTGSYALRDGNNRIRLFNPQIVNGLQTVKSIYNAVAAKEVTLKDLDDECLVQVKVIKTSEASFINGVVQATNNQNPMAARNLKSNSREQKSLRTKFAALQPRWFLQVKEGEWESLSQEGARFFRDLVGFPPSEFRVDPAKKRGRIIDNQEVAKAWLAFTGFSDLAGDRVTHYFSDDVVYRLAFTSRPHSEHWSKLAAVDEFDDPVRQQTLEQQQGDAEQYLLAFALWQFIKHYVPSPQKYREEALNEGVRAGKITKASGSFTSTASQQESYLDTNHTYQTWRLMANMKEVLVEAATTVLIRKYGPLTPGICWRLLESFDLKPFLTSADLRVTAREAAQATDLAHDAVFARIAGFLRHTAGQFWEEKESQLRATSRLRVLLLRRDLAADFKRKMREANGRRSLEKSWKPAGKTFVESLPQLG
jgi:hypothetical protein